jgi:rhodanese-related sulfurtransferase
LDEAQPTGVTPCATAEARRSLELMVERRQSLDDETTLWRPSRDGLLSRMLADYWATGIAIWRRAVSRVSVSVVMMCMILFAPLVMAADEYISPEIVPGATTIDTAKAKALFDKGVVFVDVRSDADWEAGRIPGAVHLEWDRVLTEASLAKIVQKDREVVIYCNGVKCPRSSKAAAAAVTWGFTKVSYYRLGFPDWKAAGEPVE